MAVSTTYDDVQAIVPDAFVEDTVDIYIAIASSMVDNLLGSSGMTGTVLEQIERFLTAHLLYTTIKRQTQQKSVGDASESYAKLGEGLKATTYGAIVAQLDYTGALLNAGKTTALIEAIPSFDDSEVL
jgi:hypothetical protein